MTLAEAVALVTQQAQTDADPTLSAGEVEALVERTVRATVWAASTAYTYGALVVPTARNGYVYRVRTAGTGSATEPSGWPTFRGNAIYDGDAVLEWYGLDVHSDLYDVNRATAEAWRLKAAKVANRYNFSADGQSFSESQLYQMCISEARRWTPLEIA